MIVGERVGADPEQCLICRHSELDCDDAGRLVDLRPVLHGVVEARCQHAGRSVVLQAEHGFGEHFDQGDRVVLLSGAERALELLVDREDADLRSGGGQRVPLATSRAPTSCSPVA